jgi:hypothetical protein
MNIHVERKFKFFKNKLIERFIYINLMTHPKFSFYTLASIKEKLIIMNIFQLEEKICL